MADIAVTPANVKEGANASKTTGIAGESITSGQAVFLNTATQKWMKAQSDGTLLESGKGTQYGIALTTSSLDQPIVVDTLDAAGITIGGTTIVGTIYVVSATPGGICPWADLVATNYVTIIGVGATGNKLVSVGNGATGIQHA